MKWHTLLLSCSIVTFSFSSFSYANPLTDRLPLPSAAAHQGGLFLLEGNTLQQFRRARKLGIDVLEMDLRLTQDGVPIVFHDPDLFGWTWCMGKVNERTFAELEHCPYRFGLNPIVSFREVLIWNYDGRLVLNVEFKEDETIEPALKLIHEFNAYDWVFFQIGTRRTRYQKIREISSEVSLLMSINSDEDIDWIIDQEDENLVFVDFRHPEEATSSQIERIHKAGKRVAMDVWNLVFHKEILGAACTQAFQKGADLAVSNTVRSCVKQRNRYQKSGALEP